MAPKQPTPDPTPESNSLDGQGFSSPATEHCPEAQSPDEPPPAVCGIVPPFLLARVAATDPGHAGQVARETLAVQRSLRIQREARSGMRPPGRREGPPERSSSDPADGAPDSGEDAGDGEGGSDAGLPPAQTGGAQGAPGGPGFVPDRLQRHPRLREHRPPTGARAVPTAPATPSAPVTPHRSVHDAEHGTKLPGVLRRGEGQPVHSDESVNEAYDGLGATWTLLHEAYGRNSLDGAGLPLVASVHFAKDYDNAFWDGEQMVFGDGDGQIFGSFTDSPDVIGHELAHGLTQFTAGLVYVGQSGALNEHVSDVFGVLTVQRLLDQSVADADWLVGKGLFRPGVKGVALRSMKEPGTAYDDPRLGKDPQPGHMDGYKHMPHDEANDNGGVHINSGIPNRAFYLTATQIGGKAWEAPGRIWFETLVRGGLPKDADFTTFAAATVRIAQELFGADSPELAAVRAGWGGVGVAIPEQGVGAGQTPASEQAAHPPTRSRTPRAAAHAVDGRGDGPGIGSGNGSGIGPGDGWSGSAGTDARR